MKSVEPSSRLSIIIFLYKPTSISTPPSIDYYHIWKVLHELEASLLQASQRAAETSLVNDADIVFCTLSAAGRRSLADLVPFTTLVIDESAQATEAESLIPLRHMDQTSSRFLLVGDPKQLPATVLSPHADAGKLAPNS